MKKKKLSLIAMVLFMGIFAENAMAAEVCPNAASKESDTRLSSTSVPEEKEVSLTQALIAEAITKAEEAKAQAIAGVKAAGLKAIEAEARAERAEMIAGISLVVAVSSARCILL